MAKECEKLRKFVTFDNIDMRPYRNIRKSVVNVVHFSS